MEAQITKIPFVHDIQEGSEVILHRIGAVHIVVDCNEAHTFVGEHDLSVETNLKVVSSKAAHVLHDDGRDVTGLDFLQHFVECRTIEVDASVTIIREMPDIQKTMLNSIIFKVLLLIDDSLDNFLYII